MDNSHSEILATAASLSEEISRFQSIIDEMIKAEKNKLVDDITWVQDEGEKASHRN